MMPWAGVDARWGRDPQGWGPAPERAVTAESCRRAKLAPNTEGDARVKGSGQ